MHPWLVWRRAASACLPAPAAVHQMRPQPRPGAICYPAGFGAAALIPLPCLALLLQLPQGVDYTNSNGNQGSYSSTDELSFEELISGAAGGDSSSSSSASPTVSAPLPPTAPRPTGSCWVVATR